MARRLRSGIGRTIDLRYPSNLFAAVVTPVAGLVAGAVTLFGTDEGFWDAVRNGVLAGGAAFLAWAVGRELDPDRPLTANAAAVVAPAALLVGDPSLGQLFAVLLAARILLRSTGYRPLPGDLVVVVAVAVYVGTRAGGLPVALALAMAVSADVGLPGGAPPRSTVAALAAAAGAVIAAAITGNVRIDPIGPAGGDWALVGLAALGALVLVRPALVRSSVDRSDEPMSPQRLRMARVVAVGAGLAGFAWLGGPSLAALAGAWTALALTFVVSFLPR